jgi:hypothetical protein
LSLPLTSNNLIGGLMTADKHQHLEIRDGDRVVTSADVMSSRDTHAPTRAILHAEAGHIPPGSRADLVDAVLDLPEVQDSDNLEASVSLGDAESLLRLEERCDDATTRAAGSTALVDAQLRGNGGAEDDDMPAQTDER